MAPVIVEGWTLVSPGEPRSDLLCPHGFAVAVLNERDYALNYADDPTRLDAGHLAEWLAANHDDLPAYCTNGHRPGAAPGVRGSAE